MTELEIVRRVYKAYKAAGMTDAGIWGMLGNAMCESTLCPYRLQNDYSEGYSKSMAYTQAVDSGAISKTDFVEHGPGGGGYGFYQWTYQPRKDRYYNEARKRRCSIGDLQLAIDFSLLELKTDFSGSVWPVLRSADSISEASNIVCRIFENPEFKNYGDRYKAAKDLRDKYAADMDRDDNPETTEPEQPKYDDEGLPIPQTWPPRTVDNHCSGWAEVWLLQGLLKCRGKSVLVDGIWGTSLTDKVILFQQANGLSADGVVGPMTWQRLGLSAELFKK